MEKMIGWHFSRTDETLNYGDGRSIAVGETHSVEPPIRLCARGLHAGKDVSDALVYAPGPILYKVELSGQIIHDDHKSVATHRKYLARLDCTSLLDDFARACALSVVHLWEPENSVLRFLLGDESKRAAAYGAARAAAGASDAAGAAAWAAWAAEAAAWAAEAAGDAAWAAARDEQSTVLQKYVLDAIEQGETA